MFDEIYPTTLEVVFHILDEYMMRDAFHKLKKF